MSPLGPVPTVVAFSPGAMLIPKTSMIAYYVPFTSSAVLGVPAVLITMIVVSLMTKEPSAEIKELLYKVHNDEA